MLLTKYLRKLFNYNLISDRCRFLMTFIDRTRVLVGTVIFKARSRNNNFFSIITKRLLSLLNPLHPEHLSKDLLK